MKYRETLAEAILHGRKIRNKKWQKEAFVFWNYGYGHFVSHHDIDSPAVKCGVPEEHPEEAWEIYVEPIKPEILATKCHECTVICKFSNPATPYPRCPECGHKVCVKGGV